MWNIIEGNLITTSRKIYLFIYLFIYFLVKVTPFFSFDSSTFPVVKMPSSERRGRAYQCKHCPWKGEIKAALEHACKHVEVSPFHCMPCDFKAATEQAV